MLGHLHSSHTRIERESWVKKLSNYWRFEDYVKGLTTRKLLDPDSLDWISCSSHDLPTHSTPLHHRQHIIILTHRSPHHHPDTWISMSPPPSFLASSSSMFHLFHMAHFLLLVLPYPNVVSLLHSDIPSPFWCHVPNVYKPPCICS